MLALHSTRDSRALLNWYLTTRDRILHSRRALSWFDQGVVSGTSFISLLLVARWADAAEVGSFALGMSVVAILLAIHEALVVRPYTIRLHGPVIDTASSASTTLWLTVSLCVLVAFGLFAAWAASYGLGVSPDIQNVLLALGLSSPWLLLRELARKEAYAHLQLLSALKVSVPACVLTLAGLAILGWGGMLSASTAIGAIGLASGVSGLTWLLRKDVCRIVSLASSWRQSWKLGRWFLAAQIGIQAQAYSTIWITLMMAGATMAGVYAACISIVAVANPLLLGFSNLLIPESSRVLHEGGLARLRLQTIRSALQLGAVIGIPCIAIATGGDWLMNLLYPAEYQGHGWVLVILALATWSAAVGIPASVALAALQRPGIVAGVVGLTAVLNIALMVILLPAMGLLGAALAVLTAEAVGSAGRWFAFYLVIKGLPKRMRWEPASHAKQ